MGRILAIDYGTKRTGLAVTDILKISANGLPTVRTHLLFDFLKKYLAENDVDTIVIGEPKDMHGRPSENMAQINIFLRKFKSEFPNKNIVLYDERFTSTIAHREMITAGLKKSQRQEKGKADEMAAILILTSYLDSRGNI